MIKTKHATIRCDDYIESVIFEKTDYTVNNQNCVWYEIRFEDAYCNDGNGNGIIRRFKRAWSAFCAKPVVYSAVCCGDTEKVRKFLIECFAIINSNE